MLIISLTCEISRIAATRGIIFLPNVVAGASIWEYWSAILIMTGATLSANWFSNSGESSCKTFFTSGIDANSLATLLFW